MDRLCRLFKMNSEEVAEFQYIRLNIKKNRDNVKLRLNEYKKKIEMYPSRRRQKFERLNICNRSNQNQTIDWPT